MYSGKKFISALVSTTLSLSACTKTTESSKSSGGRDIGTTMTFKFGKDIGHLLDSKSVESFAEEKATQTWETFAEHDINESFVLVDENSISTFDVSETSDKIAIRTLKKYPNLLKKLTNIPNKKEFIQTLYQTLQVMILAEKQHKRLIMPMLTDEEISEEGFSSREEHLLFHIFRTMSTSSLTFKTAEDFDILMQAGEFDQRKTVRFDDFVKLNEALYQATAFAPIGTVSSTLATPDLISLQMKTFINYGVELNPQFITALNDMTTTLLRRYGMLFSKANYHMQLFLHDMHALNPEYPKYLTEYLCLYFAKICHRKTAANYETFIKEMNEFKSVVTYLHQQKWGIEQLCEFMSQLAVSEFPIDPAAMKKYMNLYAKTGITRPIILFPQENDSSLLDSVLVSLEHIKNIKNYVLVLLPSQSGNFGSYSCSYGDPFTLPGGGFKRSLAEIAKTTPIIPMQIKKDSELPQVLEYITTLTGVKPDKIILAGHGSEANLAFRESHTHEEYNMNTKGDTSSLAIQLDEEFLDFSDTDILREMSTYIGQNAQIILEACSNGKGTYGQKNMANLIASEIPGSTIIASENNIQVSEEDRNMIRLNQHGQFEVAFDQTKEDEQPQFAPSKPQKPDPTTPYIVRYEPSLLDTFTSKIRNLIEQHTL